VGGGDVHDGGHGDDAKPHRVLEEVEVGVRHPLPLTTLTLAFWVRATHPSTLTTPPSTLAQERARAAQPGETD